MVCNNCNSCIITKCLQCEKGKEETENMCSTQNASIRASTLKEL